MPQEVVGKLDGPCQMEPKKKHKISCVKNKLECVNPHN